MSATMRTGRAAANSTAVPLPSFNPLRQYAAMSALISHAELPKWIPGKILRSSDELDWRDLRLRSYRYASQEVEVPGMRDFLVIAYRDGTPQMERRLDGRWTRARCRPGDISLLTHAQRSQWRWSEPIEVSHVYLSDAVVSRVAAEMMDRTVAEVELHDVLSTRDPSVTAIVHAIDTEAGQRSPGGGLYADALAVQLAVQLLRGYASVDVRRAGDTGKLSPAQERRVTEYIEDRLQSAIDLDSLAAVVGLGVWTFGRRFRASFGCAPHGYVVKRRVQSAERLIRGGSQPLKQIALMCGFSDQAHMTRLLRRHCSATPAALRRESLAA